MEHAVISASHNYIIMFGLSVFVLQPVVILYNLCSHSRLITSSSNSYLITSSSNSRLITSFSNSRSITSSNSRSITSSTYLTVEVSAR